LASTVVAPRTPRSRIAWSGLPCALASDASASRACGLAASKDADRGGIVAAIGGHE